MVLQNGNYFLSHHQMITIETQLFKVKQSNLKPSLETEAPKKIS